MDSDKPIFIDTHAHIQFEDYGLDKEKVWEESQTAGVKHAIIVGCDVNSSVNAVKFAKTHAGAYAAIGIHPHQAKHFISNPKLKAELEDLLRDIAGNKIVAIGEFGLDYFYENSPKADQLELLRYHLQIVKKFDLPAIFHIRDAFDDFWKVYDEFAEGYNFRAVVHCFSSTKIELQQALDRGLYVALNGIMTFTKDEKQLEAARAVPLDKLLLETDAPFLTPKPLRGKICEPKHVLLTGEFLSSLREESIEQIANQTTKNAKKLFNIR